MNMIFNSSLITLNANCRTAEQAIVEAGKLLVKAQLCSVDYISAMKQVYQNFGAYIVLDNAIAMPHARPEHGAKGTGFSIVTLNNPIEFGNEDFDPVTVVVAIVANELDTHIDLIQLIATLIENDLVSVAKQAATPQSLVNFIEPFIIKNS
ncbi:PTS sugar transporter subunit IIA [uncultured Gilliamella sp.]|jgi:Phosphotransferase system mannitol/fructose-specific IIA domain (Ntr-type)|uniref:PTS sugar transporter subunit IIA n=1 Tax=uncultured Gilliamella sp. TaxID=1193505 RepID=UPI0025CC6876|nr:PTS sugar transporter subunit IIA [uncultured Gilliamella sp.]